MNDISISEKIKLRSFIYNYINKLSEAVVTCEQIGYNKEKKTLSERFQEERNKITERLKKTGLNKDILNNEFVKSFIENELEENVYSNILPNFKNKEEKEDFVNTMFLSKVRFSTEEITNIMRKKIKSFDKTKSLNNLFDSNFTNIEDSNIATDFSNVSIDLKEIFLQGFKELKTKDEAELILNISIFYSKYTNTDLGNKHLEIINKNYIDSINNCSTEKGRNEAKQEWLDNILEAYNMHSPKSLEIRYDDDKKSFSYNTQSSGLFDAHFFIDNSSISKKQLENFTTIQDIKDFKSSSHNTQYQVSVTSNNGTSIEKDSVLRHSLANTLLSAVLNTKIKSKKTTFSFKMDSDSLKYIIEDSFEHCFNEKEKYEDIVKKITKDPLSYMAKLLNKKDLTSDFSEEDMKNIIEISSDGVFKSHSIFSLFRENRNKSKIYLKDDFDFGKFNELNQTEHFMLIQTNAIFKNGLSLYNKKETKKLPRLKTEAFNLYFENNIEILGYTPLFSINNDVFSSLSIRDIDKFIIDSLVFFDEYDDNKFKSLNSMSVVNTDNVHAVLSHLTEKESKSYLEDITKGNVDLFYSKIDTLIEKKIIPSEGINKSRELDKQSRELDKLKEEKEWFSFTKKVRKNEELTDREKLILIETENFLKIKNIEMDKRDYIDLNDNAVSKIIFNVNKFGSSIKNEETKLEADLLSEIEKDIKIQPNDLKNKKQAIDPNDNKRRNI